MTALTPDPARARQLMFECIQTNADPLLGSIRVYVTRMGLANGEAAREIANELLQETVVEALAHAEKYQQTTSHPLAWLRGVSLNIIRRRRAMLVRRQQHELPLAQLALRHPYAQSELELLEQWGPVTEQGPELELESKEQVEELLMLVSDKDQQVLTLALLESFEPVALAQRLGTTPGTARMRLHRALTRLRAAWFRREKNPQGDVRDE